MAEATQWTPEQIGRLTLYQLRIYASADKEFTGKTKVKAFDLARTGGDVKKAVAFAKARKRAEGS